MNLLTIVDGQLAILAQSGGWQGVVDGRGVAISLTGMLIVFIALATISLFIGTLPKVLALLEPYFPESAGRHHHGAGPAPSKPAEDDGAVIAAIGYAVHAQSRTSEGSKQ